MTGHCKKCKIVRNLERVRGPVGSNQWVCKICGTKISTGGKSDD